MDYSRLPRKRPMAFSLFRKGLPEPPVRAAEPVAPVTSTIEPDLIAAADSAKEILELLELELGGMIRQLERADALSDRSSTQAMREVDVPIRIRGRHWGGFRTAYRL